MKNKTSNFADYTTTDLYRGPICGGCVKKEKEYIVLANYGTDASSIDVTKKVRELYYAATSKPVTIGPDFNSLFGDPIVGTCKRLEITVLLPGCRFKVYTCYE
jgi:hypothetical protein